MKLAVIGSRDFSDYEILKNRLDLFRRFKIIDEIVSGGAYGADKLAEKYAKDNNIPIKIFLPNWNKHGRVAGPIRNRQIIEYCDSMIAFWDCKSKGTLSSINICEELNVPYQIIKYKEFNWFNEIRFV